MDEQEMIRFLRSELDRAMERDPELRAALKHIDAGKGTFQDTAQYSERTSELLGQILSRHVDELPEGMRETVCSSLLRERYEEVNGICAEVQEQLDAQNGIRLQPQKAPYPAERVQQVAHALEDPTVLLSVIQRRARAPVANVSKSFHDDYMKKNADVRSRLGFKCYINRVAAAGCCKWCTEIAGHYVYGDEPEEVFHRHDNCSCTTTFENGRERQDVWSKRTWQADPAEVEARANDPVVNSQKQAREIEQRALQGLTLPQANPAKAIGIFNDYGVPENAPITAQSIIDDLKTSSIGREILEYAESQGERILLDYKTIRLDSSGLPIYGEEIGGSITIYLANCENAERAARTVIHECTHHRFGIGQSQWAECVCFAQELKHKYKRDTLTNDELRRIIKAVKAGYPEYNWRKGGFVHGKRKNHH